MQLLFLPLLLLNSFTLFAGILVIAMQLGRYFVLFSTNRDEAVKRVNRFSNMPTFNFVTTIDNSHRDPCIALDGLPLICGLAHH